MYYGQTAIFGTENFYDVNTQYISPNFYQIFNITKNEYKQKFTQSIGVSAEKLLEYNKDDEIRITLECFDHTIDSARTITGTDENSDEIKTEYFAAPMSSPISDSDYICSYKIYNNDKTNLLYEYSFEKNDFTSNSTPKKKFKVSDFTDGILIEAVDCASLAPITIYKAIDIISPILNKKTIQNITENSCELLLNSNESGFVYFKIVTEEVTITQEEMLANTIESLTAENDKTLFFEGLNEKTNYTIYLMCTDVVGNKTEIETIKFTTLDITVPQIINIIDKNIQSKEIDIAVITSEVDVDIFYLIAKSDDTDTPTYEEDIAIAVYYATINGEFNSYVPAGIIGDIFQNDQSNKMFLFGSTNIKSLEETTVFENFSKDEKLKAKANYKMFLGIKDKSENIQNDIYVFDFKTKSLGKAAAPTVNFLNGDLEIKTKEINFSCSTENSKIKFTYAKNKKITDEVFENYDKQFVLENTIPGTTDVYNIQAIASSEEYDDSDMSEYYFRLINLKPISEITPVLKAEQNKNIINFKVEKILNATKYSLFNFVNNMYVKIMESESENFSFTANFETEYKFCVCVTSPESISNFSNIVNIETPKAVVIIPYGKQHHWPLVKNTKDIINNFDFESKTKKFIKNSYEYFFLCNNEVSAICSKTLNPFYSFTLCFNIVFFEFGINAKIISNENESGTSGWSIVNNKEYIYLKYNGTQVTKKVKIAKNEMISVAIEFNRNKQIIFYINQECIKNTIQKEELVLTEEEIFKIGAVTSKFGINEMFLYKGIYSSLFLQNPIIIKIENLKNKNKITFTNIVDADEYKVLRSESKYGKYNEIGRVKKEDK